MNLTEVLEEAPAFVREFEWDEPSISDLAHYGANSGVFMPAVTYADAKLFMAYWGDDVVEYINDCCGELLPPQPDLSWSGINVFYMSTAFELWAQHALLQLEDED